MLEQDITIYYRIRVRAKQSSGLIEYRGWELTQPLYYFKDKYSR